VNAIQFLKQEHQKAKAAFEKVLQASPQLRGQLWQELAPELELHEQMEDACLYEPLSRDAAQSDRELATWRSQHQQEVDKVGGLIEETRSLRPEDAAWLSKVKEIHSSLETHIQEEEGDIFPRVGRVWDENRLERAEAQMRDMMSKRLGRRVA
jgi:iron-sulfur cluster repair protein YtfE (RIC family)